MVALMQHRASVELHNNPVKGKGFSLRMKEVLVYFVASSLSGGNLPAYLTIESTFMATKLLCEPLVYSNVPLSLLFSFGFRIGKRC